MGKSKKKYRLQLNTELCKGCRLCVEFCPKHVLGLTDDKINNKGYPFVEVRLPDDCIGCRACTAVCPDCVIELFEIDEEKE